MPATAPGSRSPPPDIGRPASHLKDASGAAPAAGLRPVLDLPSRSPRHGSYQEQETPVTHAPKPPEPRHNHP